MKEKWVEVEGYPNYKISNYGRFRNITTNRLNVGTTDRMCYKKIRLFKHENGVKMFKDYLIHILVAKHFIANEKGLPFVNHIDENKLNCRSDNLEWVTPRENCNHGTRNERISSGYPVCEYDLDGKLIRIWNNAVSVSKVYNIASRTIHDGAMKVATHCYGRQWRYYEETKGKPIGKAVMQKYIADKIEYNIKEGIYSYPERIAEKHLFTENTRSLTNPIDLIDRVLENTRLTQSNKEDLLRVRKFVASLMHR